MATAKEFERLPTTVKPELYNLYLQPDLNTFTFYGKETISIDILEPVSQLVLNCKDLKIKSVVLNANLVRTPLKGDFSLSIENETVTLSFPEQIPVGAAELTIEFDGELNNNLNGFYRSKFINVAGEKDKYFAVTQFESCEARKCFPCWDEPALKAKFDVMLSVDSSLVALSNMPVEKEEIDQNGKKLVKFARTPIMSTYLLAFVVGDFEYIEETSSDGIVIRVYTPLGKKEQGRFALHVATRTLPYYKDYFKIAFPLPKMDLIAISEMSPGAMENWGLITYLENLLLVDEKNSSAATKQLVALVVGHELAHQWFGNLVTMEWWTHLWLNEGYATFVEYLCVDHLFPEYDIWTQFVTDVLCTAMKLDALKNSHPIEVPIGHPSEIDEIFDEISYEKGASVIRMLHRYIGDFDFRKGMNIYLTRHKYGNTFTEDLWVALEEASSKPIKAIMSTWTKQVGFPVVTVEDCTINGTTRTVTLSQSRFTSDVNAGGDSSHWLIPVSFCTKTNPDKEHCSSIVDQKRCIITINNVSPTDWLKLNQGTVGFYRTKYPPELLQEFLPSIEDKSLPPMDRLGIIDDLFALVQAGHTPTTEALDLLLATKNENNYTVWNTISACLGRIHTLLQDSECMEAFEKFGLLIMRPIYEKLGCEKKAHDSHLTSLLRSLILCRMVRFGATDFQDIVRSKFEQHLNESNILPPDERNFIYRAILALDGKNAYNQLMNLFRNTDLQEEKCRILTTFSAITDANLIDDVFQLLQSNELTQNYTSKVIAAIAVSKVGRNKTFEFFKKNWDQLYEKFHKTYLLQDIVKCVTENFNSIDKANEVEEFFANKNIAGISRIIKQSLETIRNNASWLSRDQVAISHYLQKF